MMTAALAKSRVHSLVFAGDGGAVCGRPLKVKMGFRSYYRVWFIFSPHIKGEVRESAKKTMLECIIEGVIGRTVE